MILIKRTTCIDCNVEMKLKFEFDEWDADKYVNGALDDETYTCDSCHKAAQADRDECSFNGEEWGA